MITTKERIQQTAIKLFYEQGYQKTTIAQIAKACDISTGVVSYHYKTKNLMGNELNGIFSLKRKNVIAKKYYDKYKTYNLQYAIAMEWRLLFNMFLKDPHVLRFQIELSNFGSNDKTSITLEHRIKYFERYFKTYHLEYNEDQDELALLAFSVMGASNSLLSAYFQGDINCDSDFACNYHIQTLFTLLKIPPSEIQDIIDESKRIYNELDISIKPYFVVE